MFRTYNENWTVEEWSGRYLRVKWWEGGRRIGRLGGGGGGGVKVAEKEGGGREGKTFLRRAVNGAEWVFVITEARAHRGP